MCLVCEGSLLLVEMADQRRFDLQFEFMVLIKRVCFVVLQTWSIRKDTGYFNVNFIKVHFA